MRRHRSQDHVQLLTILSVIAEAQPTTPSLQVNKCARSYVLHLQKGNLLVRRVSLHRHHFLQMGELVSVKLSFVVMHLVNMEAVTLSEIMNPPDQMNVDSSNERQSPRINSQQVDDIDYSSRRQSIAVSH